MKKKLNTGEIVGVVIGIIIAVVLLIFGFFATVYSAGRLVMRMDQVGPVNDYSNTKEQLIDAPGDYSQAYQDQEYYETFENAIRTDLDYDISWETYTYEGQYADQVTMRMDYPVVSGNIPNIEQVDAALFAEIEQNEAYVESMVDYLGEGQTYDFSAETYVTYMDADVFSVIYMESGVSDSWEEHYLIAVNIDVRTGMVINHNDLINVDDAFAVDFRERNDKQNGATETITAMSDQNIVSYLTDDNYGIAFYTPLGMEIGFNYPDGWVTVTYKDYQNYQKKY